MSGDARQQILMSEICFGEFEIEDDCLCFTRIEADCWKKGFNPIEQIIKNYFNEYLAAEYSPPDHVIAVFVDTEQDPGGSKEEKNIHIEKYRATYPSPWLSVAFGVSLNGENYHLCCTLEKKITFKRGECPNSITGDKSDVIFFSKSFSAGHACKFESSLHKDHLLAIKEEDGRHILYLKRCTDAVDEGGMFTIHQK